MLSPGPALVAGQMAAQAGLEKEATPCRPGPKRSALSALGDQQSEGASRLSSPACRTSMEAMKR